MIYKTNLNGLRWIQPPVLIHLFSLFSMLNILFMYFPTWNGKQLQGALRSVLNYQHTIGDCSPSAHNEKRVQFYLSKNQRSCAHLCAGILYIYAGWLHFGVLRCLSTIGGIYGIAVCQCELLRAHCFSFSLSCCIQSVPHLPEWASSEIAGSVHILHKVSCGYYNQYTKS